METQEDKTDGNKPIKKCAVIEENHAYYRNRQKDSKPSNLKTFDDVMIDVEEATKTSLGDQHLVSKLRAKGYNLSQKCARGEVGDFDHLKNSLYRIQITDRDERGEYPIAWVIDIELQKIYEH